MTCKEVEQMIMPYINDELTDKQLGPFLEHINACKNCYEELEIYYTIYAGLSQLDGENEGRDMHNILQEALHASEQRVRGRVFFNLYYLASQVLAMGGSCGNYRDGDPENMSEKILLVERATAIINRAFYRQSQT